MYCMYVFVGTFTGWSGWARCLPLSLHFPPQPEHAGPSRSIVMETVARKEEDPELMLPKKIIENL